MKRSSSTAERADAGGSTDYTRLYKAGAVLCYMGILVQLPYSLTSSMSEYPAGRILFFLLYFAGIPLGYAVQALSGKIFGLEQTALGDYSYEDSRRYYSFPKAFLCHFASAGVLIAVISLLGKYWYLYRSYYDYNSVIPLFVGLGTAAMTEVGGWLWFFPYNSLVSMSKIGVFGVILLILLILFFGRSAFGFGSVLDNVCLIFICLSIALFLLILNQSFITRSFGVGKLFGVNDNAKRYSVRIVGIYLAFVFGAPFLLTVVLRLLLFILKILGRASIAMMIGAMPSEKKNDPGSAVITDGGGNAQQLQTQPPLPGWYLILIVLALVLAGVVLYLLFPAFRKKAKHGIEKLRAFIRSLLSLRFNFRSRRRGKTENINYVDTEARTRKRNSAFFGRQDNTPDYRDFERRLDALPTLSRKLRYAYAVAARLLIHQNCQINPSDTPRELSKKVQKRSLIPDIGDLTEVFEQVSYREKEMEGSDAQNTLERLKVLVRQYFC